MSGNWPSPVLVDAEAWLLAGEQGFGRAVPLRHERSFLRRWQHVGIDLQSRTSWTVVPPLRERVAYEPGRLVREVW